MIVEFVGPPGAGKSTAALQLLAGREHERALAAALSARRHSSSMGRALVWPLARAGRLHIHPEHRRAAEQGMARYPDFIAIASEAVRTLDEADRLRCWSWILGLLAERVLLEDAEAPMARFEEGFIARGVGVFARRGDVTELQRWVRAAPRADVVVLVDAAPEVCFERISDRPRGRPRVLQMMSEEAALEWIREARELSHRACAHAEAVGIRVVRSLSEISSDGHGAGVPA